MRGIACGGNRLFGFLAVLDIRDDQALRSGIEQALDEDKVIPLRANQRGRSTALHCLQLGNHARNLVGRMLHVNDNPVEA